MPTPLRDDPDGVIRPGPYRMLSTLAIDFFTQLPTWVVGLMVVLFIFISLLMVMIVLIQRPQGGGLSGAFGADAQGAGQTAFGAKTGDALTTGTILIFVVFIILSVVLNWTVRPPSEKPAEAEVQAADATTGAPVQVQPVAPPPALKESFEQTVQQQQQQGTLGTPTTLTPVPPAGSEPPAGTTPAPSEPTPQPQPEPTPTPTP